MKTCFGILGEINWQFTNVVLAFACIQILGTTLFYILLKFQSFWREALFTKILCSTSTYHDLGANTLYAQIESDIMQQKFQENKRKWRIIEKEYMNLTYLIESHENQLKAVNKPF